MSDIVFNVAKGRAVELANRVKTGDPSAAGCMRSRWTGPRSVTHRLDKLHAEVDERLDGMHDGVVEIRTAQVRHLEAHAEGRTS